MASLCALTGALALTSAPTLAARGHVFQVSFGGPCLIEPCEGSFKEPSGVAVNESTGDVYVVDKGANRVARFSSSGVYEAEINGPSATGTGSLTEGSATIESVLTETGALSVGEEVTASEAGEEGLEAGTTIEAVDLGAGTLTLSKPATKTLVSATLKAHESFSSPEGIAVDNSCALRKTLAKETACKESDLSAGDVYVADTGHNVLDKFTPTGEYVDQLTGTCLKTEESPPSCPGSNFIPLEELFGVGVDAKGEVWVLKHTAGDHVAGDVAEFNDGVANKFVANHELSSQGPFPFAGPGFAVDSQDTFYVLGQEHRVAKYDAKGELVAGAMDAEQSAGVAVEPSSDNVYVDNVNTIARFGSDASLVERIGSVHLTSGGGLAASHANGTVYVADSATGMVDIFSPAPPSKPTVESESVFDVTLTSATFSAEINPRGASTEYHFEYGPCATPETCASSAYEKSMPVPGASTGADFEVQSVSVHPQDLLAGTVYHFRVVAHNVFDKELETVVGEEQTFTTQTEGAFGLPDSRAWEMVSPPDKHGALLTTDFQGEYAFQAAAAGDAITYLASAPTESQPQGYQNLMQVLSTRGPEGWSSRDIEVPHSGQTGPSVGNAEEYRFFSSDLSLGAMQPFGGFDPSLSAEASEQTPYLRTDYQSGNVNVPCLESCYRPLVTGKLGYENVPKGTRFGGEGKAECPSVFVCGPRFRGATPDFSHVVLSSDVALTSTGGSLYEWSAGRPLAERLQSVSVLPGSKSGTSSGSIGDGRERLASAISENGSRVVWHTNLGAGAANLYMRDVKGERTVELDLAEPGCVKCASGGGHFQVASSDGSKVFFTDQAPLTEDAGAASNKPDLYECEIVEEKAGKPECRLSDLTPLGAGEERADLQGAVLGASKDGSRVYFVADGVLAAGAERGQPNLYVRHDGTTALVAALSPHDSPDWAGARGEKAFIVEMSARVSPNGRWLEFMSQQKLTSYDNRDALSGRPDEEVYLYDAESKRLVCASCEPTGARPSGQVLEGEEGFLGGNRAWEISGTFAAIVPGWTTPLYQSRYLSDTGRLFFDSKVALVPQDVNGTWDVYEYEPEGTGPQGAPCGPSSAGGSEVFKPARVFEADGRSGEEGAGCVGLISSGRSAEASAFLDASESGGDVFFLTSARLSLQDFDTSLDVYDAHECTTQAPCVASPVGPPPCSTGDSCKPAPSPQPEIFGSGPSETFSGAGNIPPPAAPTGKPKSLTRAQKLSRALKACKKKPKKKRPACEKQARRAYAPARKAKKSRKGGK